MIFVPVKELQAGMTLKSEICTFNLKTNRIERLNVGQILTDSNISDFAAIESKDLAGAYIDDGNENTLTQASQIIPTELKSAAIFNMKQVYKMFDQTAQRLNIETINQTTDISQKLVDIIESHNQIMINIFDLKMYDDYTYNHSLGVAVISIAIGTSLGLSKQELCELGLCALLHDIGKTQIPIEIINKPGRLTEEEFNIVKKHPSLGADFLQKNHLASDKICEGVRCHHEKYDGTGYPNGLAGKDICLFGRIISVADVFDALTSARPYHTASLPKDGIEYIMGGSEKAFDIDMVLAFLQKISPYPVGSCVKLSNEELAIVISQTKSSPLRPKIRLLTNPQNTLDLYSQRDLQNIVIEGLSKLKSDRLAE